MVYTIESKNIMLEVALQALKNGLSYHSFRPIDVQIFKPELQEIQASFVTLEKNSQLRGCIGSLEATEPLILNIAHNAYRAGFKDPRFPPVTTNEIADISLHISVLSQPVALPIIDEKDLLNSLQIGTDGLILQDGAYKSTFLPSVWSQLPTPREFIKQLKLKAGLPANYWSNTIHFYRYKTQLIE